MCWVGLPPSFDSLRLAQAALQMNISLPPGPLFSVKSTFKNFLAINLSSSTDDWSQGLSKLEVLFREYASKRINSSN
jgi:DNA-binding transcriptional MocR family regulator